VGEATSPPERFKGAAMTGIGGTFEICQPAMTMSDVGRFCCKSRKLNNPKNLAKVYLWTSLLLRRFSTPLRRSVIDFG
jgi:hypothetical protein